MKTRIVLTLTLAAAVAGCGGSSSSKGHTVVASFYPLAFAAEEIGGPGIDVRNLTPPGVEPHDLELSGSDVRTIADAGLVLYFGARFQPALDDAIESTSANGVDVLAGLALRMRGEERDLDPHVWLDPVRTPQSPCGSGKRSTAVPRPSGSRPGSSLWIASSMQASPTATATEFVTSHAAFGYLAERYGLKEVAITGMSPEAEPTPRVLERVVQQVRATRATTIFFETLVSPRLAETVAREVGATTAVLNPLEGLTEEQIAAGDDYFSVMRENLAALREALGCR